ncbi:hypothetical protein GGX14DRAFT_667485 [Mycena pura]|uniref:F-box domain-containing protein n=1 Tax=Mycena pura TaxID=153505 RepID=A0AAD6Y7D6_9AGAR|nr:hypothetical protein GGX14DRAFT_667485 [Mycena pura]
MDTTPHPESSWDGHFFGKAQGAEGLNWTRGHCGCDAIIDKKSISAPSAGLLGYQVETVSPRRSPSGVFGSPSGWRLECPKILSQQFRQTPTQYGAKTSIISDRSIKPCDRYGLIFYAIKMKPPHLNDDVLFYILTYLDVTSVIQCQRVSRHFQALTQSRQVWMSLARDLGRRGLIDLPLPDLSNYSTMQLVTEVKRIVVGPTTWLSHSDRQPTVHRQLHIPLGSDSLAPQLLPGGRHLLVERGVACELWDIVEHRRILMRNDVQVAIEFTHGKEELTLAVVISTMPMTIQVLRLNLHNDMQHIVASPKLPSWSLHISNTVIKGDFVLLVVNDASVLLLNWKETKCVILPRFARNSVHLIPGHLVALTSSSPSAKVLLYPFTAFESHWFPMTSDSIDAATEAALTGTKPTVLQQVEYPEVAGCRAPQLFVHECPLHHSSFIVSTNRVCGYASLHLHPSFHRFPLTVSAPTSPSKWHWRHLFSSGSVTAYKDQLMAFTYAGYGLSVNRNATTMFRKQVIHRASTDGGFVPISPQKRYTVSLSQYSGALCVCSDSGVDILYYTIYFASTLSYMDE